MLYDEKPFDDLYSPDRERVLPSSRLNSPVTSTAGITRHSLYSPTTSWSEQTGELLQHFDPHDNLELHGDLDPHDDTEFHGDLELHGDLEPHSGLEPHHDSCNEHDRLMLGAMTGPDRQSTNEPQSPRSSLLSTDSEDVDFPDNYWEYCRDEGNYYHDDENPDGSTTRVWYPIEFRV